MVNWVAQNKLGIGGYKKLKWSKEMLKKTAKSNKIKRESYKK